MPLANNNNSSRCTICKGLVDNCEADTSHHINGELHSEELTNGKRCIECNLMIHLEKLRHCLTCATNNHDNQIALNQLCADCCLDRHHDHDVKRFIDVYKEVKKECTKIVHSGTANAAKFHRITVSLHAKSDRIRASLKSLDDSINAFDEKLKDNATRLQACLRKEDFASNQKELRELAAEGAHIFEAASMTSARIQIVLEQCERSMSNINPRDLELTKRVERPVLHASAEEIRFGRFLVRRAATLPKRRQTLPFVEQSS